MSARLLGVVLLLCAAGSAAADSVVYPPRVVRFSEEGDAYAIVLRDEGFRKLRVYRTRGGEPVPDALRASLGKGTPPPREHVRVGERALDSMAGRLLVGSGGRIVATVRENLERSTPDDQATAIEIHGFDPVVNEGTFLADLLSEEERAALPRSVSSVDWYECAWLDEQSGHCIVLGHGPRAWAVSLRDGKVGDVTDAQLTAALRHNGGSEGLFALRKLLDRPRDDRSELLRTLVTDPSVDRAVHFHALAELGATDVSDSELASLSTCYELWATLHELAWQSRVRTSVHSVAPIPRVRRLGALRVLGLAGRSERDLDVLLHAAADPDDAHAAAAVAALTRQECPALREELRDLLTEQPRHTRALAAYYAAHRDADVVPLLVDALERVHGADDETAKALVGALRHQTGVGFSDPAGWRRWLDR